MDKERKVRTQNFHFKKGRAKTKRIEKTYMDENITHVILE